MEAPIINREPWHLYNYLWMLFFSNVGTKRIQLLQLSFLVDPENKPQALSIEWFCSHSFWGSEET